MFKQVAVFERGIGSKCIYFLSVDETQVVENFSPTVYYNVSRKDIENIMDAYMANEISNPDASYQV